LTVIKSVRQFKVSIAGMTIEFIADDNLGLELPRYHQFITEEGSPDLTLRAHYGLPSELKLEEKSTDQNLKLDFCRSGGKQIITARSSYRGLLPFRVVMIDEDFRHGDIYNQPPPVFEIPPSPQVIKDKIYIRPTDYLDRILFSILLSRERGIIIHSCGVIVDGEGLLFTGVSGAGKSTLAKLWQKRANATVICDESVVIRWVNGRCCIYGTPWYSSARIASPLGAPLKKILFIHHGTENYTAPLKASDAVANLLAQTYSDYSEYSSTMSTLEFLNDLIEQVPCHELRFVPDESVLDYILKI
jgi:hypothetical protein